MGKLRQSTLDLMVSFVLKMSPAEVKAMDFFDYLEARGFALVTYTGLMQLQPPQKSGGNTNESVQFDHDPDIDIDPREGFFSEV
jgi:hypothetical protein